MTSVSVALAIVPVDSPAIVPFGEGDARAAEHAGVAFGRALDHRLFEGDRILVRLRAVRKRQPCDDDVAAVERGLLVVALAAARARQSRGKRVGGVFRLDGESRRRREKGGARQKDGSKARRHGIFLDKLSG